MSETKFTPGPWEIKSRFVGPLVIASDDVEVAHVGLYHESWAQCVKNATLIAAAPDLYAALDRVLDAYVSERLWNGASTWDVDNRVVIGARAALARARGETDGQ